MRTEEVVHFEPHEVVNERCPFCHRGCLNSNIKTDVVVCGGFYGCGHQETAAEYRARKAEEERQQKALDLTRQFLAAEPFEITVTRDGEVDVELSCAAVELIKGYPQLVQDLVVARRERMWYQMFAVAGLRLSRRLGKAHDVLITGTDWLLELLKDHKPSRRKDRERLEAFEKETRAFYGLPLDGHMVLRGTGLGEEEDEPLDRIRALTVLSSDQAGMKCFSSVDGKHVRGATDLEGKGHCGYCGEVLPKSFRD